LSGGCVQVYGLLVSDAPLSPAYRRALTALLRGGSETEIAAGLMAVWLDH
jgi:hypothetical protein